MRTSRCAGPATPRWATPVEVKNLNSFRYLERALNHEIERQAAVLDGGGRVDRETRLFDVGAGRTVPMRSKELAHDYRYFPEPDLPPLAIDAERIEAIRRRLPEMPAARRRRLADTYGLSDYDAGQMAASPATSRFFEARRGGFGAPEGGGQLDQRRGDAHAQGGGRGVRRCGCDARGPRGTHSRGRGGACQCEPGEGRPREDVGHGSRRG